MSAKDISAKSAGFNLADPDTMQRVFPGSVTRIAGNSFKASSDGARQFLANKFGEGSFGQIIVQFDSSRFPHAPRAHAFNFSIENGNVIFKDFQNGLDDSVLSKHIWGMIDPSMEATVTDLSTSVPNWDELGKLVTRM